MKADQQGNPLQGPSNLPCPFFAPQPDIGLPSCEDRQIALLAISGVYGESNPVSPSALSTPAGVGKTTLLTWQWSMSMMQSSG